MVTSRPVRRLVGHHSVGEHAQGRGDDDALAHSSRKLSRIRLVAPLGRGDADSSAVRWRAAGRTLLHAHAHAQRLNRSACPLAAPDWERRSSVLGRPWRPRCPRACASRTLAGTHISRPLSMTEPVTVTFGEAQTHDRARQHGLARSRSPTMPNVSFVARSNETLPPPSGAAQGGERRGRSLTPSSVEVSVLKFHVRHVEVRAQPVAMKLRAQQEEAQHQ